MDINDFRRRVHLEHPGISFGEMLKKIEKEFPEVVARAERQREWLATPAERPE